MIRRQGGGNQSLDVFLVLNFRHIFIHIHAVMGHTKFQSRMDFCMTDVSQNCRRTGKSLSPPDITTFMSWFTHPIYVYSDADIHNHVLLLVT